ncbi:MAG: hypothetical protein H7326_03215 [Bdellovibrionaceae bacterium]|nr:hypothetical protein [Pseudobdellovibrionaceae bacterium]
MRKPMISLVLLAATLSLTNVAMAAPGCGQLFGKYKIGNIVESEPFEQWLIWEQEANFSVFRKTRELIKVPVSHVPKETVDITYLNSATPSLRKLIGSGDSISWFKHPYNSVKSIPHFEDKADTEVYAALTASRSLGIRVGEDYYTLKMPTDRPHGPKGQYQPAKATVKEDIMDGINRMTYIERVDAQIGLDPQLLLAKEVAMVADKTTGEGYLFRDLSFMKSGNYYLPALSIPYVGREIADYNHKKTDEFWKANYAELLGRSKAKLLLRYGAQMETPNSQNMLIELDGNLKPTGRMVFRDISDTILIVEVADALGETATLRKDAEIGVENGHSIQPYWSNSAWRFDEAGDKSFSHETLKNWGDAHDAAYKKEIEKALNVNLSKFTTIDNNQEFDNFMASPIVRQKLKQYRNSMKEVFKRQPVPAAVPAAS